jgi:hypothetical protein
LTTEINDLGSIPDPPGGLRLTRGGGGPEFRFPPKNHLCIFTIFVHFTLSSSRSVSEQTGTNFKNMREVFSQHGLRNKNLSQFFQRHHEKRESKASSRPIFPDFQFSVSVPILQELSRPAGDEFGETERGFCPAHVHIQ